MFLLVGLVDGVVGLSVVVLAGRVVAYEITTKEKNIVSTFFLMTI